MRFISTRVHGMLDYLMGALLIASPWLFDFNRGGAETWIPVILGAGVILYSLFTDYELSASRQISMPTHLWLDILGGAFLAVSPWLFNFDEYVYMPHLIFGLAEVGAGLFTKKVPDTRHVRHHDTTATGVNRNATIVDNTGRTTDRAPMGSANDARTIAERERERAERDRLR